ncbi:asparagine synthase (glutamine-hydrolyzing) [soil metagenome]
MCGIAGFFNIATRETPPKARDVVAAQIACLRYRGPDAASEYVGHGVGLGHARLSVIDTSSAANQPMSDAAELITLVLNGEIYNFQELRTELEAKGHVFKTHSDTEVIVEGYLAWGVEVVHRLRGMFAIAIYDSRSDRLILLRDRVGKKPLFYAVHEGVLVFGSEIKAVLRYPGMPRTPNLQGVHDYLTFQYVPSPATGFEGIYKLPPAHMIIADRGRQIAVQKYWELPHPASATRVRPIEELCGELVHELREATRLRMIADVPIGAFLSGGVDSSAVVAMMALESSRPVRTFTIGFEEQAYDERPYARMVAERYGTDHTELTIRPDGMSVIEDIVYHYGEPYADSSAIPTYYVSKIAREQVTVALNGDGGDESFLGYPRYAYMRQVEAAATGYTPRSRQYEPSITYFSDAAKLPLYGERMKPFLYRSSLDGLDPWMNQGLSLASGAAWADMHTYLPDDLLVKVDVASMAHSLEARSPLLDQKLMAWAAQIPEHQRFAGTETKSLFKKAMEPYLPHDLLYRPKMGFGVPIDHWLRGDMRQFAYDTLLDDTARARGMFEPAEVKRILDLHSAGENWASRIWAMLMLELWFRIWIDGQDAFSHPTSRRIISRYADRTLEPA